MPVPRLRPIVPTLLAALLLAACGSADLDQAGEPAAQSVTPSASESSPDAWDGEPVDDATELFERVSAAAGEASSVRTQFSTNSAAGDVVGEGVVRFGDDYAADLAVSVPGGTGAGQFRVVIVDQTFHLQLGSEIGLPAGTTWIALTADDQSPLASSLAPVIEALGSAGDVEQSFAALKAGTELRPAGPEVVDGVPTMRYDVTIDVAAAIAADDAAAESFQAINDLGVTTFEYAIWVDADDLPRRYSQTFDIAGSPTTTTATYSDWGTVPEITAPPADQVASLADLLGTP